MSTKRNLFRQRIRKGVALIRRPSAWRYLRGGVLPGVEHGDVPFDPNIKTVLDVGAARGQFTVFALDRWPAAIIHCFEPLPGPAAQLAELAPSRVQVTIAALGDTPGEAALHLSGREDSSSLLPIGDRQVREFPETRETGTEVVAVTTLDEVVDPDELTPLTLLKIDVQGGELAVLRGAGSLLGRIDEIYVECAFVELYAGQPLASEVISFLLAAGFQLRGVFNLVRGVDKACLEADMLFRQTPG